MLRNAEKALKSWFFTPPSFSKNKKLNSKQREISNAAKEIKLYIRTIFQSSKSKEVKERITELKWLLSCINRYILKAAGCN